MVKTEKKKDPEYTLDQVVRDGMTKYRSVKTLKVLILNGDLDAIDKAPAGSKYARIVVTRSAIEAFNKRMEAGRPAATELKRKKTSKVR